MARTRSSSPDPLEGSATLLKRLKTSHVSPIGGETSAHALSGTLDIATTTGAGLGSQDALSQFASGVLDHNNIARLHNAYITNEPFKYAVVEKLFQDELLVKVKEECLNELNFSEKETDIYKVNQTGDLASLNYLPPSQVALLSNLLTLRNALYSPEFRSFLRAVTGCGPLSGQKQDMSVNSYTKGCHLLNHDDVIGTRRVSYILYMPLPHYQLWQKDWGGALELYPVKPGPDGQLEPEPIPLKSIPPSWNQFIFFEVQPGRSFHSVEEVVVGGECGDGRERLSISGWFHAAQKGEEGYTPDTPQPEVKSSREQLTSTSTVYKNYPATIDEGLLGVELSEEHISFLSEFLNPVYLQTRTLQALASRFAEESSLELHSFLLNELASSLEPRLRDVDSKDGLGEDRADTLRPHNAGTGTSWVIKGPPHKWRYSILKPQEEGTVEAVTPRSAFISPDQIMRSLQDELFPSAAFRAWLLIVSRLMPLRYATEARRFRPGLDYTLATSDDKEARLDVVLGLTPTVREDIEDGNIKIQIQPSRGWQSAEWGGWECYMAPHNEEDDPAVYRSSTHKKAKPDSHHSEDMQTKEEEEEEDSTLLTVQPGFNRLLLVLRDERVMRFVKYISAAAEGSRWDICAEYEIGMVQEEEEDD